jgi:hypothetical protein
MQRKARPDRRQLSGSFGSASLPSGLDEHPLRYALETTYPWASGATAKRSIDADHFKVALGQVSTAKHLIETISRDYVRLLKVRRYNQPGAEHHY